MNLLADAAVFRSICWIIIRAFVDTWKVIKQISITEQREKRVLIPVYQVCFESLKERTPKKKCGRLKNVTSNILFYGVSMRVYKCVSKKGIVAFLGVLCVWLRVCV